MSKMTMTPLVKPTDSQWTDDQWQAIVEKGQDILVAAAAGSGKTAVLVERIIRRLTDPEQPIDVDRLLIVTFTNAAAAEMRGRIGEALEKELAKAPNDQRLREQLILLGKAPIMTFHAFCQSVIRNYYYRLDIDPGFRIAEQTEAAILREDVLIDLFETYYASTEDQDTFYELVDRYSNDRSDQELFDLIMNVYDFSQSHPWPDLWLDELAAAYEVPEGDGIDDVSWIPSLKVAIQEQLEGAFSELRLAEQLAQEPGGPTPYLENLQSDQLILHQLLEASRGPWEAFYQAFTSVAFSKLKACRGTDYDEDLKTQVKAMRDEVKKTIETMKTEAFAQLPSEYLADLREMAPFVTFIVRLVKEFREAYRRMKRERGLLDFSDLEHDCLAILRKEGTPQGEEVPSEVAEDYRQQFEELLIDEYQDTNQVQETVLWHVSKGNNRFMVGDVKQSIYRFRLADPSLFLEKYKTFNMTSDERTERKGRRIDLSQNFRSRKEVLDGTNFIFQQVMDERVGEIDYDERAALRFGSMDYETLSSPVELHLINGMSDSDEAEIQEEATQLDATLGTAQLEAHLIATKIHKLLEEGFQVYDKSLRRTRPLEYRDIVILSRSVQGSASTVLDVLKERGIPSYAELSAGYFEAVEVSNMMSLLKVIDNPYQDIPFASVLRSPLVGLNGEELSQIRLSLQDTSFYEAYKHYLDQERDLFLKEKLLHFDKQLDQWRNQARRGALAELIWQIYRETGYYDYVAGLVGGDQRQANLKAFYDRARQYEQTSFRGLFRFLRFIERLQDRGGDLGEARALSEQEDVVRLMTIHKSKGLEFPVVFVMGMNKQFNKRDIYGKTLLHKSLGFGTKLVNSEARFILPTLAHTSIKKQIERETIAEEMRILYVALTRAREKLILVGSVSDAEKSLKKWGLGAIEKGWLLPSFYRSKATRYLDWMGPAVSRHQTATGFHELTHFSPDLDSAIVKHPSNWVCEVHTPQEFVQASVHVEQRHEKEDQIRNWQPVEPSSSNWHEEVLQRLSWTYPNQQATAQLAKLSVTEIKRQQDQFIDGAGDTFIRQFRQPIGDRPAFLSKNESTASELGTLAHRFMQLVTLKEGLTIEDLKTERDRLIEKEMLDPNEARRLSLEDIHSFFESEIGKRLVSAQKVVRELPFSLKLPVHAIHPDWKGQEEMIMVQGVMDCLYLDEDGWHLLDYKTDRLSGRFHSEEEALRHLKERYRVPMTLYQQAIERIWKQKVSEVGLWFFDGGRYIELDS